MDIVARTVRDWAATPFVWGTSDCGTSALRYAEAATGRTVRVRPTHKGLKTARMLLKLNGGFARYAAALFGELGLIETASPGRGDVGLIDIPGQGETMCLCLGGGWIAKGDREVLFVKDLKPAIAWKVPSCPRP